MDIKPAILIFILSCLPWTASAQKAVVTGKVTTTEGEPAAHVNVSLKNTNHAALSNREGIYTLTAPAGNYILVASSMSYETVEFSVELVPGRNTGMDFEMREASTRIESVVVKGKSLVSQVRESSFNVVAIDAAALHNTSLDLAHTLDRMSGVKLRETGGVGSGAQISLNGFSGRHVKIFMDGIPMEGGGSSFQINNIPVGLAERIEVYKGVVPIELGSDALGGAINIITRNTANTYLDASYSFGSFNTHRSNINFGHVTRRGFMMQLNAYQNYSDNSYKVKTQLLDLENNTYSNKEYWFKRFHDMYRNEAVILKTGVSGKKWADRLLLGATLSQEHDEIQNANLMKIVYGGKLRKSKSVTPTFNYEKKNLFVRHLDLSVAANYNFVRSNSLDTMARQYNWLGEYRDKNTKGEGQYTNSETNNNSFYVTGNLRYRFAQRHFVSVNNVYNSYSRKATDAAANVENSTATTFMKRTSSKNVLGLSYRFSATDKLNFSAFGKYYAIAVTGPVDVSTGTGSVYEQKKKTYNTTGYGAGATYILPGGVQLKASFEQAYRLPTERELFGDEILETGDASLKPENSRNINFNANYNGNFGGGHALYAEAGFIYRYTRDYIRRQIEQRYGGAFYSNHGKVRNTGMDFEARYFLRDRFSAGGNLTWQNIRNRERYTQNGVESVNYNGRMPNVPYFFSSFDMAYNFRDVFAKKTILSISYTLNYVHRFYRSWESEGASIIIPSQLSHDVGVTYSMNNGMYNIALEAKNIGNEILYDNYSLQKPGRSFYVKFRYFFFKSKDLKPGRPGSIGNEKSCHGRGTRTHCHSGHKIR